MKIETQQQGAVTVVTPHGPINRDESEEFRANLNEVFGTSLGRFVLDMSQIPFVDSSGLEALLDMSEQLEKSGHVLKLCGTNETIREVFDVTDLAQRFEYFEDTTTAVRSFL